MAMLMSGRRGRAGIGAFLALSIGLVAGCSSDGHKGRGGDALLAASSSCGGFAPAAVKAIKRISAADDYSFDARTDLDAFAGVIADDLKSLPGAEEHRLCRMDPKGTSDKSDAGHELELYFQAVNKRPWDPGRRFAGERRFPLGRQAKATGYGSELYFSCVPRGISRAAHTARDVGVYGRFHYVPARQGDLSFKEEMTVLQDISYKLAKKLGCLPGANLSPV